MTVGGMRGGGEKTNVEDGKGRKKGGLWQEGVKRRGRGIENNYGRREEGKRKQTCASEGRGIKRRKVREKEERIQDQWVG